MPRQKDFKRLVRTRMRKTGEAYTAARAQILRKSKPQSSSTPQPDYAELAGMSDAKVKENTGCTWQRWVKALDHHGADEMSHRDIARLVNTRYKIDGWWSQMVTVGYERIKGLRAKGQRLDGTYEANKSRTFNVPVATLFDAWADGSIRRRWLNGATVKVRTATAPKSMRLGWTDGTIVAIGFLPKGKSKSSVALAHTKLPDRETADRLKRYWSEPLDVLGEMLADW
ncbi:MAG: hypothetical protein ACREMZ_06660 [Gemmatimonadales bacterium]